jgi:hypothetical protein
MPDSIAPEWEASDAVIDDDSALPEGKVLMIMPEAGELLTPARAIDGFRLGRLVDASTGMVVAALENSDELKPSTAAAGAADIVNVLVRGARG